MKVPAGEPADHGDADARTLDEIFGEVLPQTTSDERDPGDRRGSDREFSDDWYLDNRPPHHDR